MKGQFLWKAVKSITVEPVLFFYMMLIFLETNALQELISVKSCIEIINPANITDCIDNNSSNYTNDAVKQEKASWVRYNGAILFLFTFLSSFFVASWSDKFGRKFPMLIPPLGTLIAACINCVLSMYIHSSTAYILISSTISGITFGTVGIIATTFGFITDISDESSRTKRLVILEAMIYIGGTLGIYIAGKFIKHFDYSSRINGFSLLFIFEICVAALILFYIVFRIPNRSNDYLESTEISFGNLFKLDHVKSSVKAVFRPRDAGKRKVVLLLSLTLFFIYFGLVAQFTLSLYFLQDTLHWTFSEYSDFNSMQFAVQGSILLLGMPVFFHFLKVPDHLIAALGILSKMAAYVVFGLSNNNTLVYSCIACYMFSEYPVPAIRSILSKIVDVDEKGRIFAFTTILQNFCFLIGSFVLTSVFKSTTEIFPGLCFEIVAALQAIALLIVLYLYFTRGEIITMYEVMENEDGSVDETCTVKSSDSIN